MHAYRALTADETPLSGIADFAIPGAFKPPYRCDLKPGPTDLSSSTLQRSEWGFLREGRDYGENWYLLVRAIRKLGTKFKTTRQDFGLAVTSRQTNPGFTT